jgi:hypothetical protein
MIDPFRNADTIKHNVCKKLSQLTKVISIFEGQSTDRALQRLFLRDTSAASLNLLFTEHAEIISQLNSQLLVITDEIETQIDRSFRAKYEQETEDFASFLKTHTSSHSHKLGDISRQISVANSLIASITQSLQTRTAAIQNESTKAKSTISHVISQSSTRNRGEIQLLIKESEVRMRQAAEAAELRIARLTADHEELKKRLKIDAEARDREIAAEVPFSLYRMRLRQLLVEIENLKMQLESEMKAENYSMIENRQKATVILSEHRKLADHYRMERNEFQALCEKVRIEMAHEIHNLKELQERETEHQHLEFGEWQEALKLTLSSLESEIQANRGKGSAVLGTSEVEMKDQLHAEMSEIETALWDSERSVRERVTELEKKLLRRETEYSEIMHRVRIDQIELAQRIDTDQTKRQQSFIKETEQEMNEWKTKKGEFENQIASNQSSTKETVKNAKEESQSLQNERDKLDHKFQEQLRIIEENERSESIVVINDSEKLTEQFKREMIESLSTGCSARGVH